MTKRNAIITASYAPDFERCRVLCETVDRHASGHECHYILVAAPDHALFSQLEGPKRKVLTDTELLPWWFRRVPEAMPLRRRLWLSPVTVPLHGWHVQQVMRIAVAHHLDVDGLFYCDSDTAFVRPFDLGDIWHGDDMRLYRLDDGALTARDDHLQWADHAAFAFGLSAEPRNVNDYVGTFLTWKRQTVVDMCDRMERVHGRHWISVVGSTRKFSECMLYGGYVDGVTGGAGHFVDPVSYCAVHWYNPAPDLAEMQALVDGLSGHQVGIGIQSFVPVPLEDFRTAVTGIRRAA